MVWMQNVNLHSVGITLTENIWEPSVEEDIWVRKNGGQGGWIVLHNMLHGLHSLPDIIKMIKS